MTDTTEVQPIDLAAAPLLFECGDRNYRFDAYAKALDEIERLRETVTLYVKAMRLNADPKGKWFKS
jgi:hypothetical protein